MIENPTDFGSLIGSEWRLINLATLIPPFSLKVSITQMLSWLGCCALVTAPRLCLNHFLKRVRACACVCVCCGEVLCVLSHL